MVSDPLEYGYLLMTKRPRLVALASWLTDDQEAAGVAVRCTLSEAWWSRDQKANQTNLDQFLVTELRNKIVSKGQDCSVR